MKIRLSAFGEKLVGYMEVPENTTFLFDLVLMQPIQVFTKNYHDTPMMNRPLNTRCTFEWTGKNILQHTEHGENLIREYVLTKISQI